MPACMITKKGQRLKVLSDKLQVFVDYYEDLYKSSTPEEEKIDVFGQSLFL